jgi:hypothetical protein
VPLTYNCQRLYVVSPWRTIASTGAHYSNWQQQFPLEGPRGAWPNRD